MALSLTANTLPLQEVIYRIFGVYEPLRREFETIEHKVVVTETVIGYDSFQTYHLIPHTVTHIEYIFNWSWAVSVLLFVIVLCGFLKCVGGILRWRI